MPDNTIEALQKENEQLRTQITQIKKSNTEAERNNKRMG